MTHDDHAEHSEARRGGQSPDRDTAQRAALGRDLLRFDALDAATDIGPSTWRQTPIPHVAPGSVGASLGQLISTVAARSMVWGETQLSEAAHALTTSTASQRINASLYTNLTIMNVISHAIEERVIRDGAPTEVYAGFQRLSLLRPQITRYRALLGVASHVLVYGLDDLLPGDPLPAHSRLVPLRIETRLGTGLEAFWFVVSHHPRLSTALVARHTDGDLWSRSQGVRAYTGFWTFDPAVVERVVTILRQGARLLYRTR